MKKKQTKAQKTNYQKYYPLVIFISILFMSVGYAIINSINLDVSGEAIAKEVDNIYITEVNYVSSIDANTTTSHIITAHQTMLSSEIFLSTTNPNSSITYNVKFYNSNPEPYEFSKIIFINDENIYSNEDIIIDYENGGVIYSKDYLSVNITFKYKNGLSSDNSLMSYLNFEFEKLKIYPIEYVSMGYNTTISIKKITEYPTLSASDIIFELDYIKLPDNNAGAAPIKKTYNAQTGSLTMTRSAVSGYGTVNFKGNLYAIPALRKEVATISASTTATVDCTSIEDYRNKTSKDFVYDMTQITLGAVVTGETSFTKEYNAETGSLTITRTPVSESDGITFKATIYTVGE